MKKALFAIKLSFLIGFILSFSLFCLRFLKSSNPLTFFDYTVPVYDQREEYDPSLIRLNSVSKLRAYCDSLCQATCKETEVPGESEKKYASIVTSVIRKRFYWGYSCYGFNNNYLSILFSKITQWGYDATVIPDDILKYPYAACSQQSIVMMEVLKYRGFATRKVGFYSERNKAGHFALEVYYGNRWHFFDPTLEPDSAVLNKLNRPEIKYLAEDTTLLKYAYRKDAQNKSLMLNILTHYSYGKANIFPAPNALIFHRVTKFLSDTIYIFFLFGYFILQRAYQKRKHH